MLADSARDRPGTILEGLRVLDLSQGVAGPLSTMLLAEAGADVVKVEPPEGDVLRGTSGFATWNRSKRSMVLDLHRADHRRQLVELLPGVDVVVHGFLPEAECRFGLEPATLSAVAPHLVVGRVRGYPAGHPDEARPGWDPLVLARLGILDEQAGHRPGPVYLRFPLASMGAAYLLACGVLARLFHHMRSGRGGPVTTSLIQGALVSMTMHWFRAEHPSAALAAAMPKSRPVTLFQCSDGGWIHIMKAPDDVPLMRAGLHAMGPDAVAEANAATPAHPVCPNQGANALVFRQRPAGEWLEHLWAHDIPAELVRPMGAVFDDEQARANGYVVTVDDPRLGTIEQAGTPFHTEPPSRVVGPAPALGAHTAEVLDELRSPSRQGFGPWHSEPGDAAAAPLEGVRVVDMGSYLAGPLGPMLLADLGADVIKIEPPRGDAMRWNEAAFEGCQRGKRSVCIDLTNPADRPLLDALVRSADVVHHNIRSGSARTLGVDGPRLRTLSERLVFCHVSAYGPSGARATWPGFDQLFQATTGWELEAAGEGNPPMWHRFGMMDHLAAMASVVATLLGLIHRERTGRGQEVTSSLLGAAVLSVGHTYRRADGTLAPAPRLDRRQMGTGPTCRLYELSDGWVAVVDCRPGALARLCAAVGASSEEDLEPSFKARETGETLAVLATAGVPVEEVRLDQRQAFLDDETNRRCRLVVSYPHRRYGSMAQIGALWDFGDLGLRLDRAAPTCGQHSDEVLAEVQDEAARRH